MEKNNSLSERLALVKHRLAESLRAAGRPQDSAVLVAVSKFHPASEIAEAAALGQVDFGENYEQEAAAKQSELALHPDCRHIRWHFIGHLQSRKASLVTGRFSCIHTIDSKKLAECVEKSAAAREILQNVLIQVNIGDEPQKSGVSIADLPNLAETVCRLPHLALQGLMCLPPVFDNGELSRPFFAKLRDLRDSLRQSTGLPLPHLSMGMSGDLEAAVAEGATIVRVGTDIFGPRPPKAVKAADRP